MSVSHSDPGATIGEAVAKLLLPLVLWVSGLTVNQWVGIFTLVYLLLQIAHVCWQLRDKWRRRHRVV